MRKCRLTSDVERFSIHAGNLQNSTKGFPLATENNDFFANFPDPSVFAADMRVPEVLSHYTSLEGFLSIIQSNTIRASNILFLNDKEEMQYGIDVAKDVIGEIEKSAKRTSSTRQQQPREIPGVYASCFCENADMLSQWRGYGAASQSVSIQFDGPRLHHLADAYEFDLEGIIYGRKRAMELLRKRLEVEKSDANIMRLIYQDEHTGVDIMRYSRMINLGPRVKNEAFSEEKKWLIIAKQEVIKQVHYRVRDNVIMPFVKLNAGNGLPIVRVTFGRGKDTILTEKSISKLLSNTQFYKNVDVVSSTIPLRS